MSKKLQHGKYTFASVASATPLDRAYAEGYEAGYNNGTMQDMRSVWILEAAAAWRRGYVRGEADRNNDDTTPTN